MTRLSVLIPIYRDWEAAARLLADLGAEAGSRYAIDVLFVDDGSLTMPAPEMSVAGIASIDILRLRRNLGHQRAIAIGLAHLEASGVTTTVVVMDGDGEDRPSDVPALVAAADAASGPRIVFAERMRRSEGWAFTALYHLYRCLHWLFTGERVRVGNFSVIPAALLPRLVAVSELWNHYAAAIFKSRLPYSTVPTERGVRYAGRSSMNYVALVTHGLSAMAAFGERIGVRLLAATALMSLAALLALFVAMLSPWLTGAAPPAWLPFAAALFLVLMFQALSVSLTFVFMILGGRDSSTFLPLRDYRYYVLDVVRHGPP